jgi:hypothetical protein
LLRVLEALRKRRREEGGARAAGRRPARPAPAEAPDPARRIAGLLELLAAVRGAGATNEANRPSDPFGRAPAGPAGEVADGPASPTEAEPSDPGLPCPPDAGAGLPRSMPSDEVPTVTNEANGPADEAPAATNEANGPAASRGSASVGQGPAGPARGPIDDRPVPEADGPAAGHQPAAGPDDGAPIATNEAIVDAGPDDGARIATNEAISESGAVERDGADPGPWGLPHLPLAVGAGRSGPF